MGEVDGEARLAAEQRARVIIDRQLTDAGWSVQDKKDLNLFAGPGIACREVVMKPGHGRADYLLYVDRKVVGVIEAKPEGTPLSGVEWQSAMYATGLPADVRLSALTVDGRLPFVFEASGSERVRDHREVVGRPLRELDCPCRVTSLVVGDSDAQLRVAPLSGAFAILRWQGVVAVAR